jgi:[ribosomal protein S5]-alanine N-acetyltransferase
VEPNKNKHTIPLNSVFLGDRVALRAPKLTDVPQLLAMHSESAEFFAPWSPTPAPDALEPHVMRTRVLEQRRGIKADRDYKWVFTLGEQGPIIGRVSLSQVFRGIFQNAYLGYFVDVRYKRQGLTREAVCLALDVAFGALGLHRIQAAIMPHNEASLALARSVRLRREGLAERYLQIDGQWRDHVLFAVTTEEWRPSTWKTVPKI